MISKQFDLTPFNQNDPNLPELNILAEVKVVDDYISFHFSMTGNTDAVYFSKNNEKCNRVIGLWTQTCFEFFILNKLDGEYYEFNFGTDSSWNCFIFNSYRSELTEYEFLKIDNININHQDNCFNLDCRFPLKELGHNFENISNLKISPACVVKTSENQTLYYSNKHPDSKPNFHHPESFVNLV